MKPILSIDFIRKLALATGHTSNSDVLNFVNYLDEKLNEEVDDPGFGVAAPLPNVETPVNNIRVAVFQKVLDEIEAERAHADGVIANEEELVRQRDDDTPPVDTPVDTPEQPLEPTPAHLEQ